MQIYTFSTERKIKRYVILASVDGGGVERAFSPRQESDARDTQDESFGM